MEAPAPRLLLLLLLAAATTPAAAATYTLPRGGIVAGGMTATATGAYTVSASVNSPAAVTAAGGAYAVTTGLLSQPVIAVTGVGAGPPVPTRLALGPAVPNPVRGAASLYFELPKPARVALDLLSVDGRRVTNLVDRHFEPGRHQVRWDGRGDGARRVPPGVYLLVLSSGGERRSRRIAVLD